MRKFTQTRRPMFVTFAVRVFDDVRNFRITRGYILERSPMVVIIADRDLPG